jgi:hypothetical protein
LARGLPLEERSRIELELRETDHDPGAPEGDSEAEDHQAKPDTVLPGRRGRFGGDRGDPLH